MMRTNLWLALLLCAWAGASLADLDTRTVIVLEGAERAAVLAEMRALLAGVQGVTWALANGDMAAAAAAASPVGTAMAGKVEEGLKARLPLEFRQLGMSVHQDFDAIARDAEAMGDVAHSLSQLGDTLAKCVACHAAYRIQAPP